MRWSALALALAGLTAVSCTKPAIPAEGGSAGRAQGTAPGAPTIEYNIGDVETSVKVTVQLAEKSQVGNIAYNELETKKGYLAIAEAMVSEPYPRNLWIYSTALTPRGFREGDAVLIRHRVYLEDGTDPIAESARVWSGVKAVDEPSELSLDLVPLLGELSGSHLLHARAELVWFPNTDPATIDPAGPAESTERTIQRLSNTLRITFK